MVLRAYVQELIAFKNLKFLLRNNDFHSWVWVTAVPVAHTKYARETLVLFLS